MSTVRADLSAESSTLTALYAPELATVTELRMFCRLPAPMLTVPEPPAPLMATGPPLVRMLTLSAPVLVIDTGASDRPVELAVSTSTKRVLPPPVSVMAFTALSALTFGKLLYTAKEKGKVVPGAGFRRAT